MAEALLICAQNITIDNSANGRFFGSRESDSWLELCHFYASTIRLVQIILRVSQYSTELNVPRMDCL